MTVSARIFYIFTSLFLVVFFPPTYVFAEKIYTIVIKENRFNPIELEVPAAVKVKLVIDNQDATAEEFESYDLNREKIIPGKSKGIIFIGPLKKGEYKFFGEFHPGTAQGVIRVVEHTK